MELKTIFEILKKQPDYRLKQIYQAIFKDLIADWQQASNLPSNLLQELESKFPLAIKVKIFDSSKDASKKALIYLEDGLSIETVLLQHKTGRNTVCVSSQVGCPLGCLFCATGQMNFKRNLTDWEIVVQILFWARYLQNKQERVDNIVFMGMGEPFLNYDHVLKAIKIINDKKTLNIGARHISISTIGIIEGIKKLAFEKLQINLAISLHAATDDLRQRIIPTARKYTITKIIDAAKDYLKKTNRKVMFEYLLLANFNDSLTEAKKLSRLMNNKLFFVNLITYNPTGIYKPSPSQQVEKFKQILETNGVNVTKRYSFGQDINAACGQLANKNL
jgi:23S rRNA (adenine2503-C2)-methyltransferase